ncbi:MAG: TolC family protein [Holophagales bacterium]|nr:TolC family protein [Holophagales bacterium]
MSFSPIPPRKADGREGPNRRPSEGLSPRTPRREGRDEGGIPRAQRTGSHSGDRLTLLTLAGSRTTHSPTPREKELESAREHAGTPTRRSARDELSAEQRNRALGIVLLFSALLAAYLEVAAPALAASGPTAETEATSSAPEGRTLDLQSILELALTGNPDFRADLAERAEVEGAVLETSADAWPEVDLVGDWSRSQNPSLLNSRDFEDLIDFFPDFEPQASELWTLAVQVKQPLYSGGKVRAAIDLAKLVVDITDARIAVSRLDLALDAAETYYRLLAARSALDTLEVQLQARRAAVAVVEDRLELGEATELERLRARASLVEVAPRVAEVEGTLRVEESRLRQILGLEAATPVRPADLPVPRSRSASGDTDTRDPAPDDPAACAPVPRSWGLEPLLELAFARRPELRDSELQDQALGRQRVVTRAEGRPQVDLEGAYGRQVRLLDDLEDPLFADWRVTFGVSLSLFDGGRRKGQLAQIDSQREQLRWRREALHRSIAAELERALADIDAAHERHRATLLSAEAAGEALRVAQENYRLGVALQADLLDVQDQEVRAALEADETYFLCLIEQARLRRALGLLPTEPLPELPRIQTTSPDPTEEGSSR